MNASPRAQAMRRAGLPGPRPVGDYTLRAPSPQGVGQAGDAEAEAHEPAEVGTTEAARASARPRRLPHLRRAWSEHRRPRDRARWDRRAVESQSRAPQVQSAQGGCRGARVAPPAEGRRVTVERTYPEPERPRRALNMLESGANLPLGVSSHVRMGVNVSGYVGGSEQTREHVGCGHGWVGGSKTSPGEGVGDRRPRLLFLCTGLGDHDMAGNGPPPKAPGTHVAGETRHSTRHRCRRRRRRAVSSVARLDCLRGGRSEDACASGTRSPLPGGRM